MFLRTEIDDRLVITADYAHIGNIYETCIYQITDTGLLWLSGRYRVGIIKATKLHNDIVHKIENEGKPNPLCRCGQIARQYSVITRAWLCSSCYAIEVEERS